MARKPRVDLGGYAYHVTQRGNNRDACFFAEEDYRFYRDCIKQSSEKYHVAVHAYVLMTNHVHLLVTTKQDGDLSHFMQHIGRRYVRYVNVAYKRSGTLWEGRFKSSVVDVEHYLLTCYRYIELNPVRAGMTERPSEYPWSSARWHGFGLEDKIVRDHPIFDALGSTREARSNAYRELFRTEMDEDLIHEMGETFSQERMLGGSRFLAQVEKVQMGSGVGC
ncbi:MAG: transposase [Candidatus Thiodiazotropha sp.]